MADIPTCSEYSVDVARPLDAEGKPIYLDTTLLYDHNGDGIVVKEFKLKINTVTKGFSWVAVGAYKGDNNWSTFIPQSLFLTRPDSWERLEEDLDRGSDICDYYEDCPMEMYGKSCSECKKAALKNIASRIRKLRGEGE